MAKKKMSLREYFQPAKYALSLDKGDCRLIIEGKKLPPPSKRITLHQKGLKITSAQIVRRDKKGEQEFRVARINHLPSLQQVRLHTDETLFPGYYEIIINFPPKHDPQSKLPKRQLFPCVDEPEAWDNASFKLT